MKRAEAEERVKALGGSVKSSVVKDLSFLVTNDPASGSGKNKKALALGIPVINEEEFLAILEDPLRAASHTGRSAAVPAGEDPSPQGELF
jgi:DNA ligase (NAD+)